jgi:hypothetical protein
MSSCLRSIATVCCWLCGCIGVFAQPERVALCENDVSFLWPLPERPEDLTKLISAGETLFLGDSALWPEKIFASVIAQASAIEQHVPTSGGNRLGIRFPEGTDKIENWRIAGIRIDPSAPSCDLRAIERVGSTPQIRLVAQPVTVRAGQLRVHDFAAHLVFDFVKRDGRLLEDGTIEPAVPDNELFGGVVQDLVAIKKKATEMGAPTSTQLGVHPAFSKPEVDLPSLLRSFLKKHLRADRLKHIGFMGIRQPEPWIFVVFNRTEAGLVVAPQHAAGGKTAQMFLKTDPRRVLPEPTSRIFGQFGVSTAPLLREVGSDSLEQDASAEVPLVGRRPKLREVPDIIANPHVSTLLTADCVSCHTESSLRRQLSLPKADKPFAYQLPDGMLGVQPDVLPDDDWNVRNFGWGVVFTGAKPTITMRTANEAAESASFINRFFLGDDAAKQASVVSRPLNLVVTAKSPEDFQALKALVAGLGKGPGLNNPFTEAMDKLGNVHDARFVFLPDNKLGVFTTYDDDFDRYIDLFIDEVGDLFNAILKHVKDAPQGRVQDLRTEFRDFVKSHDLSSEGSFYSAYPTLRVIDIRAMQLKSSGVK